SASNIRAFEREVGPFDSVLARAQPGRRMIGMIFEQNSRFAKFSAFLHFHAYYRARMGGVASFSFAELPQSPLRYRPENAPPPHFGVDCGETNLRPMPRMPARLESARAKLM